MIRRRGTKREAGKAARAIGALLLCLGLLASPALAFRGREGGRGGRAAARPAYSGGRAASQQRMAPAPQAAPRQEYRAPEQNRPAYNGATRNDTARPPYQRGEGATHLPQWLDRHQGMSLADQQRALAQEPGFNRLPPHEQQRLMNTLARINGMPPEQRRQTLAEGEALERLSPERRQQVMGSQRAFATLPPNRKRAVKQAFQELRAYPPEQRQSMMASPDFQARFTPQERNILGDLLTVEPYEPPAR